MERERYAEMLIEEALERGDLDPREGVGEPFPELVDDPDWWVKSFLRREEIPQRYAQVAATRSALVARAVAVDELNLARELLARANRIGGEWNERSPAQYRFEELSEVWLIDERAGRPAD